MTDLLASNLTYKFQPNEFYNLRKKHLKKYIEVCKSLLTYKNRQYLLKLMLEIIRRRREDRLEEEIQLMIHATSEFKFFQELNSKPKNVERKLHYQCCQAMAYGFFKKGDVIMKIGTSISNFYSPLLGDPTDKFYIIIEGTVNVYLPRDEEEVQQEALKSRQQFEALAKEKRKKHPIGLILLAKKERIKQKMTMPFHFIIMMRKMQEKYKEKGKEKEKSIKSDSFERSQDHSFHEDLSEKSLKSTRQLEIEMIKDIKTEVDKEYDSTVYDKILKQTQGIMPQHFVDIDFFFQDGIFKHKCVLELGSGNMFGELGILMNKPRSATIVAASNVNVAIMTAYDYKRVLKDAELQKMEDKMQFFMKTFFLNIPRNLVIKYSYNFKKRKYARGSLIYKENDTVEAIYLIKKGQIQQLKNVNINDQEKIQQHHLQASSSREQLLQILKSQPFLLNDQPVKQNIFISEISSGEFFGEFEIFLKFPRMSSMKVMSESATIYWLSQTVFKRTLNELPMLKQKILKNFKIKYDYYLSALSKAIKFKQGNKFKLKQSAPSFVLDQMSLEIQQQSTKSLVQKVSDKLKGERFLARKHGYQLEVNDASVKDFQRTLLELQKQNSKLNLIMRRKQQLLPKQEKEKLARTASENLRIRSVIAQQQGQEFVDLKQMVNYKLKCQTECDEILDSNTQTRVKTESSKTKQKLENLFNINSQRLVSSKHNMFRQKPLNLYVYKQLYCNKTNKDKKE